MTKKLLFSITQKDFRWDYFRAGGNGGQAQNKKSTGVRCVHEPSGAVGEGRDSRSQKQNKINAWNRCCESTKFKNWLRIRAIDTSLVEDSVDKQMRGSNITVEVIQDGRWTKEGKN